MKEPIKCWVLRAARHEKHRSVHCVAHFQAQRPPMFKTCTMVWHNISSSILSINILLAKSSKVGCTILSCKLT